MTEENKIKLYSIGRSYDITTLKSYDINSNKKDKIFIETPEPLDSGTSIISLPDSSLFCFGNSYQEFGTTYIINPASGAYIQFCHGNPCSKPGIVFHNGNIYAFGGACIFEYSNFAAKFEMKSSRWITISPIPEASHEISSISYNKKIIFSGFRHSKVYEYDEDLNSYSKILTVSKFMFKILIYESSRIYIFEAERRVFESGFNNPYIWNTIGSANLAKGYKIYSIDFQVLTYLCLNILNKDRLSYFCFRFNKEKKNFEKISEFND
ncbi:unnamed protein product [Blepharisma stoltei]|uniref:Kelch motif family protein n=1 Tax=Blepharisma stoltei TaxID=1481888 RepID=A0AAU9IDV6_9CILI|nr:unnamed protein product [Blepharisma stoltei]